MALILYPDRGPDTVEPANKRDFTLDELRRIIGGGYIEIVHPHYAPGCLLVIDDESKLKSQAINFAASALYNPFAFLLIKGQVKVVGDYISGIALLCRDDEVK